MNIYNILQQAIEKFPDNIAVVDGGLSFSYREVGERVASLANFLRSQGIGQGDRVSILDVNSHNFFEGYLIFLPHQ